MGLKEVSLPTGGRVWLRTRLTHAQARERQDARDALPASALARLLEIPEIGEGAQTIDLRAALAGLDDRDIGAVKSAFRCIDEATVRVCVHHSTEVVDTDGQPIRLPDDLDRLDEGDFDFLVGAARAALEEGYGDPNRSRGTSETPSSADGPLETNPPTSGMPS